MMVSPTLESLRSITVLPQLDHSSRSTCICWSIDRKSQHKPAQVSTSISLGQKGGSEQGLIMPPSLLQKSHDSLHRRLADWMIMSALAASLSRYRCSSSACRRLRFGAACTLRRERCHYANMTARSLTCKRMGTRSAGSASATARTDLRPFSQKARAVRLLT